MAARDEGDTGDSTRRALVTGSVAAGALLTSYLLRRLRSRNTVAQGELPPALDAAVRDMEIMEGRCRFYARDGRGVPIVLLHSINAAASSFEMKPIFDALTASTHRPIYALDWFGFGISDRPPVQYSPALFQRQLRRFLSEQIHQPADVVAYSLGCEYAALTAVSHPFLFRRLVLIAPTALDECAESGRLRKVLVDASSRSGLFEIAFNRLTSPGALRAFYERQIFSEGHPVPDSLVDYAFRTTSTRGAANAPAAFLAGDLFTGNQALDAYRTLAALTLFVIPSSSSTGIHSFQQANEVAKVNPSLTISEIDSGLIPQWEVADRLNEIITMFLEAV